MRNIFFLLELLLPIICLIAVYGEKSPIVDLKNGKVRGLVKKMPNGRKLNVFKSIRYGHATRFALPKPVGPWEGIYDATCQRAECPQMDIIHIQSEDCLFLNVWQPLDEYPDADDERKEILKPVIVWIYGGGFSLGAIQGIGNFLYNGAYIASIGDVVVVDMNYRLGAFGFLYSGTDDAPGNQGIHDQILALHWVQENIEKFGGDPKQVTIFGESAGSFSVSALILSPLATGLFHRAILQSGAINSFLQFSPEYSLEKSKNFGRSLGCHQEDMSEVVDCLRTKPVSELVLKGDGLNFVKIFSGKELIIMYGDYGGLLPSDPSTLIKQGRVNQVDVLFGFVHDEGAEIATILDPELINIWKTYTLSHVHEVIKSVARKFRFNYTDNLVKFYTKDFDEYPSVSKVRRTFIDIISDATMICPSYLFGELIAKLFSSKNSSEPHNFYLYRFDHHSTFMELIGCAKWMGVCHGMDVPYVFGLPLHHGILKIAFTDVDRHISRDWIRALTNFVRTGKPEYMGSVEWPKVINEKDGVIKILTINEEYEIVESAYKERCDHFWKQYLFP